MKGHYSGAHDHSSLKPSDYGAIGVMGDHMHEEGSFMLSYRHKNMLMKGMMDGDSDITPASVVAAGGNYGYMMTPTRMSMDMHMIGAMYGVTNDLTVMAMGHYMQNRMDMLARTGAVSKMETEGFGDTKIYALINIFQDHEYAGQIDDDGEIEDENEHERLHLTLGLSIPTGSTDEKGIRMGSYGNLPYAMQLGSGTFDPVIGFTYFEQEGEYSFGFQGNAKLRLGKNDEGYRRGNEYSVTSWIGKDITSLASLSARIEAKSVDSIQGADQNTFGLRAMVPTFDPENYGGETINVGIGFNLYKAENDLGSHRFGFEYLTPIYQNLNGPQMQHQQTVTLGYQLSF